MPPRLDVDGRLDMAGPRGSRFEIVGFGDRVEVRCDRLRSLRALGGMLSALPPISDGSQQGAEPRSWPAVVVLVRGQRVAEVPGDRVGRMVGTSGAFAKLFVMLPAMRPGLVLRAALRRDDPGSDEQSTA